MPTDLVLRPATPADAPVLADLHVDARAAHPGSIPPVLHSREETRAWMRRRLESGSRGWVAEQDGRVVGYAVTTGAWLDDLYVAPDRTGRGIGSALLDVVRTECPDGFCLWVFESNARARAFYRRHGLLELERTDGSGNEEQAPDVRMAWPGRDPLGFLRALVDEVDAELRDLHARRAALTRALQHLESAPVGDAHRGG